MNRTSTFLSNKTAVSFFSLALFLGVVFIGISVVYGIDQIIPHAHDLFHDFRHSIGIACH